MVWFHRIGSVKMAVILLLIYHKIMKFSQPSKKKKKWEKQWEKENRRPGPNQRAWLRDPFSQTAEPRIWGSEEDCQSSDVWQRLYGEYLQNAICVQAREGEWHLYVTMELLLDPATNIPWTFRTIEGAHDFIRGGEAGPFQTDQPLGQDDTLPTNPTLVRDGPRNQEILGQPQGEWRIYVMYQPWQWTVERGVMHSP